MIEVNGHIFDIGDTVQITITTGTLMMMELNLGVYMQAGIYNGIIFSQEEFGRQTKILLKIGNSTHARGFVFIPASQSEQIVERRNVLVEKFLPLREWNNLE
jgi:hypothetical protein